MYFLFSSFVSYLKMQVFCFLLISGFLSCKMAAFILNDPDVCECSHPFLLDPEVDHTSTCRHTQFYGNCSMQRVEHMASKNGTAYSTLVAMKCISGG